MEESLDIINNAEKNMISAVNHLEGELAKIRAGKGKSYYVKEYLRRLARNVTLLIRLPM